jgi:hypothetical protein
MKLRVSKHKAKPFKGRVRIADNSSLRKLMRAARRGLVPSWRMQIIHNAMESARG